LGVGLPVARPYRSATTVENGYTVDEPTTSILSRANDIGAVKNNTKTATVAKTFFLLNIWIS
jgi:hypothetical protein